jgi:ATP-dependent RNA helicase RhlE
VTRFAEKFSDLGLSPTLLMTLEREGYTTPTPIQAQAIPILLKGHDLLGIAQTGTGKTAAFALPILQGILSNRIIPAPKSVRTLILSPTRELASQIAESFKTYSKGMGLQIATIYGGVKYGPQYKALAAGLDILVATPGRLIDHLEQKTVDLRGVEFFVLDEADQMFDMGFVKPVRQIAAKLPHKRQNLFFSATMPKEIATLAGELLTDPKRVEITPEATTAERVTQNVIFVEAQRKRALLSELYADNTLERTLIFTRTKRAADRVAAYLQAGGVEAAAIHGDKNQGQRERALQAFRDGRVRALVATDIAARGIDVDGVTHVVNYELPQVPEAYVHRIGRTARAGKSGASITLCADDERKLLRDIQRVTRQTIPSFDRRKDQALKLLDEAILASGNTEKPTTPERLKPERPAKAPRAARHSDPDAEFVHKRQRRRPNSSENGPRDNRPGRAERPERYDPMNAERPAGERSEKPFAAKPFKDKPFGKKPFNKTRPFRDGPREDRPREDRQDGGFRGVRAEGARPERGQSERARPEGARAEGGDRPAKAFKPKSNKGKPNDGRSFAKKGGFKGNARPAEAAGARSEGAQFKRRSRG